MRIEDKISKLGINSSTTIHACAESGDLIGLQRLLRHNPSLLNETTALMVQTPLHMATSLNRVEIIKYLLDWTGAGIGKVDLEAKNVYGETPLHSAAKNGCNEAVTMLLQHGANIEARTNNSMTPLHLAVGYALRTGDNATVKILSHYNADFSAKDDGGMMPYNYLPAGVQNDELTKLLRPNITQQINNVNQQFTSFTQQFNNIASHHEYFTQQSNYTNSSWSGNQNVEERKGDYESGIKEKMDEFDYEISKIVGLDELKKQLKNWAKGILLDEKRRAMGINLGPRKPPHMAFLGNPGTGKTTVARILGKLLHSVGVLSSDTVMEVQKTDLIGEYLGQTGPKTRKKIEEAMGGILFVDEAYQLVPKQSGNHIDYGVEALEEIMSVLEDGDLLVVFAGYTEPMNRVFSSNEGFCRRVTHFFQFDNFSCKDLAEMLLIKMSKQDEKSRLHGFKLHPSCTFDAILAVIETNTTEKLRNRMNGGLVDNMLNNARENLDSRLSFDAEGDELLTVTLADLEAGLRLLAQRASREQDDEKLVTGEVSGEKKNDYNGKVSGEKKNDYNGRRKNGIPASFITELT